MAADKFVFVEFQYDGPQVVKDHGLDDGGKVQKYIDTQCLQLCEPLIPKEIEIGRASCRERV